MYGYGILDAIYRHSREFTLKSQEQRTAYPLNNNN